MNLRIFTLLIFLTLITQIVTAQDEVRISGDLTMNGNFFFRDSAIGAANTPQYDRQLYGADAWLNLNFSYKGFDAGIRFDLFNNSNLLNPSGSYTDQGIGRWFLKKKIEKFGLYGGYIYDQIGSGIIFRAYESRPLGIDQALYGIQLSYDISPDWQVKAFTGRQKQQFNSYKSIIRGANLEGFITSDSSNVTLSPGFGVIARTLDDASMNSLVANLNTYLKDDIFTPKYNSYAFTFYNTLSAGSFNWFVEAAYKTEDSFLDPWLERTTVSGDTVVGRFTNGSGSIFYTSLSYAKKGFGITIEGKRTENFTFRTRPQEDGNRGLINFLPPMTRLNTYRMTARYNAATQDLGELAFQIDARYAPSRKLSFNVNFSNITDLDDNLLYREIFTEVYYKYKRKWTLTAGVQRQQYNQEIYEVKPNVPLVETITPYFDFLYKMTRKKSIRFEAQYMTVGEDKGVKHDYGNWLFGLIEVGLAPHWTFTASNMFNAAPGKNSPDENGDGIQEKLNYPRFDIFYAHNANRFSISYVKQVEGVVCSGGICRLEPAFNGVKIGVNSTF
ncbi:DUF6029 family protein [Saprospiraceae bacterium]|jgi:hypothetical protein|nr:DUF6029 family protein [Bacteroidota bacterium]MDB4727313.1 DUF6029 family protein [Saprospiraceae bacterium]MDF1863985.1 DUF6029 family protein [Saprospiraceae bacterium]